MDASPPCRIELDNVWGEVIDEAVGTVVIVGAALLTLTFSQVGTVLYLIVSVGVNITG